MGIDRFAGPGDVERAFEDRTWSLQAEEAAEEARYEYHHLPTVRPMPVGWTRAADGTWASSGVDDQLWEVFCAECGDFDGPADQQSPDVQKLRGPYSREHHAHRVAKEHAEQY